MAEEEVVIRKLVAVVPVGIVAGLIAVGWPDIVRFLKIKQLDMGRGGQPGVVPAEGRTSYPQRKQDGDADGSGDFVSADRGGGPAAR